MKLHLRFLPLAVFTALLAFSCGKPEPEEPQKPVDTTPTTPTEPEVQTPVIQANATSFLAKGDTYQLPVTVQHAVQGTSLSARLVEAADWITLGTPGADGVPVTLLDNLSESRKAKVELSYSGAESVTVEVTQDKWDYSEFSIQISEVGPFGAKFDITRKTGYHGGYFFEVLDKESFDKLVKDDPAHIGDFAFGEAVYQSDVAYLNRLAAQHGHPLSQLFSMIPGMYSKDDSVSMPYSGLAVDTDYIFIVYGMEEGTATRKTAMCFYTFKTT